MPKFKDSSCRITAGKPPNRCVEKETLMFRTDILTEPCKSREFRAEVFMKFTILMILFKHDINSEGSTLVQSANLWINQWTKVSFAATFFTYAWNPDFRSSIAGAPSVVHPTNIFQSSSFSLKKSAKTLNTSFPFVVAASS